MADEQRATEYLLRTYEHNQHWIELADQKAGLVLAISGVLTGFVLAKVPAMRAVLDGGGSAGWIALGLMGLFLIAQLISFVFAVRVFFPRRLATDYNATRHVFPIGIVSAFPKVGDRARFFEELQGLSVEDFEREYAYQLHLDSLVSDLKYRNLTTSLKLLFVAAAIGFLTLAQLAFTTPIAMLGQG